MTPRQHFYLKLTCYIFMAIFILYKKLLVHVSRHVYDGKRYFYQIRFSRRWVRVELFLYHITCWWLFPPNRVEGHQLSNTINGRKKNSHCCPYSVKVRSHSQYYFSWRLSNEFIFENISTLLLSFRSVEIYAYGQSSR